MVDTFSAEQSPTYLSALLGSISEGVFATDEFGRCTFINSAGAAMLGYTPEQLVGKDMHETIHYARPDGSPYPSHECPFRRAYRAGRAAHSASETVWRADGTPMVVSYSVAPVMLRGAHGAVITFSDVTERQRAESALRVSEGLRGAIMNSALDAIIVMDHEGLVREFNPAAERIFGYKRDEAIGRPVADLIIPENLRQAHREGLARYLRTHEGPVLGKRLEFTAVRADGTELPVELSISVIPSAGAPWFAGYLRDISERKRTEELLRFRTALLESQNEAGIEGALAVDLEGKMISFNRRFVEMWGIPEHVVDSRSDQAAIESVLEKLTDPDEFVQRIQYLYQHPDEESRDDIDLKDGRTFDRYSAPLRGEDGTLLGRLWYVRDVTDLKQSERASRVQVDMLAVQAKRQTVVAELGQRALTGVELPALMQEAAQQVVQTLQVASCTLLELEPDGRSLVLRAGFGPGVDPKMFGQSRYPAGRESFAGYTSSVGGPVVVDDIASEHRFNILPTFRHYGIQSSMATVIRGRDRQYGVISAHAKEPRRFKPEDVNFLDAVANVIAMTLALYSREQEIRALVDNSPDSVTRFDTELRHVFKNAAVERILPGPVPELVGTTLDESPMDPGMRELWGSNLREVFATGEERSIEFSARGVDFQTRMVPERGPDGSISHVLAVSREVTAIKRAERTQRFLAEASAALAESLEYEETLANVAELCVQHLADWCAIHVVDEEGNYRTEIAHRSPVMVAFARRMHERYPLDPDATTGIPELLRTGQAMLLPEVTDEMLAAAARDEEHLEMMRQLKIGSTITVPMRGRERILGTISFVTSEPGRQYNQFDLQIAQELADRAAMAIDNANLYREMQRVLGLREEALAQQRHVEQQLTLLVEASGQLAGQRNLDDVLGVILQLARGVLAADAYAIWRWSEDSEEWRPVAQEGLSEEYVRAAVETINPPSATVPLGDGPMVITDMEEQATLSEKHATLHRTEGTRAMLVNPLRMGGEPSGTLVFYFRQPREFTESEVRIASALANLAATAIGTAELHVEQDRVRALAAQSAEMIRRVQIVTDAALANLAFGDLMGELLRRIREVLEVDGATILLATENGEALVVMGVDGAANQELGLRVPRGSGYAGTIFERGEPWVVEDTSTIEIISPALRTEGRSLAGVPMLVEGRPIGVLHVATVRQRRFTEEEIRLMQLVADRVALVIEQARLFEAERKARSEAEAAQQRLSFLADASEILAGSLDYRATLPELAALAVPQLADLFAIELATEEGTERIAMASAERRIEALWAEVSGGYGDEPGIVRRVLDSGMAFASSRTSGEEPDVDAEPTAGEDLPYFVVPIELRGHTRGAISVVSLPGRQYEDADLTLVEDIARRIALAIDNAELFEEARHAIREREEFLSIASHELKTPLTTVKGFASLLARQVRRSTIDQHLVELAEEMEAQVARFEGLVIDLLDATRIHQGRVELRPETFDLVKLAKDVVNRFENAPEKTQAHTLRVDAPDTLTGRWDPNRIDQVFTNLISNALKYSPEGGSVDVTVRRRDGLAEIMVKDEGIGISEEDRSRLFQPFVRSPAVRNISGDGLGLYITAQIAALHHGSVSVSSRPGQGSTFIVRLPLDVTEESVRAAS